MKKLKAFILRGWHCLHHTLRFHFNPPHQEINESKVWLFKGITIWKDTYFIGCSCGKCFYGQP